MTNLISGKEALIALENGEDVEYLEDDNKWNLIDKEFVVISALIDCKLRLKPQTITINGIEVPAPFEPKDGDEIWFLNPDYGCGYVYGDYDPAESVIQFGAWRTEEEIRQVVAALRQIFGGV
ncbi:hypothetical protein [Acinetobacter sp. YH12140]|uniref:hypothetical protein n=1 Tax=Acinetobacter sp. YH12140 TaxID=2601124 RepID=UPI0015D351DE|nr:hypothetical protein [Acinetobacter sp. YH12140]